MRLPEELDSPPQINIVSMIDVIFAILTFFVMSTLFLTRIEGLGVNLPDAETGQPQSQQPIVVSVRQTGELLIGEQMTSPEAIVSDVQQEMQSSQSTLVVLRADESTPHGQVVALMDQLRTISGIQLAIATEQPVQIQNNSAVE